MTTPLDEGLAYTLAGVGRRSNPYDSRRSFGQRLLAMGMDASPIQHPLQGVGRLAQALVGGWVSSRADDDERAAAKDRTDKLTAAMSEPDPQKRIGLLTAVDPELGARLSGQLAIEQAKTAQQREGLNQVAGTYGAPQSSGPIGAGPPLPSGQPNASGFNNNLGNLRVSNANWQGKGAPHNGFETFNTPQDGANAMFQNLGAYVKGNPGMTVAQAISKWAPPNENDTNLYIRQVAEGTGINPGMPLSEVLQDPALAATLLDAMTRKEKGGLPQGVTADTFMAATTPRGQGQPQPLQVNMPGVAQGSTETNGMPPAPSPQGVQGPTMTAPPVPPQRMTPRDMPPQMAAPFVDRLRRGGYGTNPAEAEQRMVADMQRALDVSFENQKLEYERLRGDYEYGRKRGDDRAGMDQKRGDEQTKQKFEFENKLRDDFNSAPAVKSYRAVVPMLESAKEAGLTRAGDLNLVYAFAKLMDPDSVVRESETGAVVATQSVMDRIGSYIGQLNGQPMLNADARAKLIAELDSRFNALQGQYQAHEQAYEGIAQRNGLNFDNVRIPIGGKGGGTRRDGYAANAPTNDELKQWSAGGGQTAGAVPQPKSREDYDRLPNGAKYIAPDGSERTKGVRQ